MRDAHPQQRLQSTVADMKLDTLASAASPSAYAGWDCSSGMQTNAAVAWRSYPSYFPLCFLCSIHLLLSSSLLLLFPVAAALVPCRCLRSLLFLRSCFLFCCCPSSNFCYCFEYFLLFVLVLMFLLLAASARVQQVLRLLRLLSSAHAAASAPSLFLCPCFFFFSGAKSASSLCIIVHSVLHSHKLSQD